MPSQETVFLDYTLQPTGGLPSSIKRLNMAPLKLGTAHPDNTYNENYSTPKNQTVGRSIFRHHRLRSCERTNKLRGIVLKSEVSSRIKNRKNHESSLSDP